MSLYLYQWSSLSSSVMTPSWSVLREKAQVYAIMLLMMILCIVEAKSRQYALMH